MTPELSDGRTVRHTLALADSPSQISTYIYAGHSAARFEARHTELNPLSDTSDLSDTPRVGDHPARPRPLPQRLLNACQAIRVFRFGFDVIDAASTAGRMTC